MAIYRTVKTKNYSIMHNGFLLDSNLSFKAKGILAYFLSKPDNWEFYTNEIIKNCKDGRDSVYTGIKELIEKGYVKRFLKRGEDGKYEGGYNYNVYEKPTDIIDENPEENYIDEDSVEKYEVKTSKLENSIRDKSIKENPICEKVKQEKPSLLNTECILSTEYKLNTKPKVNTKYKLNTKTTTPPPPKCTLNNKDIEITKVNNEGWRGRCNSDIYEFYLDNGFGQVNNVVMDILDNCINIYSKEDTKAAIIEAIKNNKYTLSYIEGILKNNKDRFKDSKGYKENSRDREIRDNRSNRNISGNRYNRYKREREEEDNYGDSISSYGENLRYGEYVLNLDDL